MKRVKTDQNLVKLVEDLKKEGFKKKSPFLVSLARRFEKPTRQMAEVNVRQLEIFGNKGDVIVVAGKVLGTGELTKPLTVAAWKFSTSAKEKIKEANGKTLSISELVKQKPKGKKVRVFA